jgi:caa(3)-type oxidase subunit IV
VKDGHVAAADRKDRVGIGAPVAVWIGVILIVVMQVVLTYAHLSARILVVSLLALALTEAGLAVMYFMHLRDEHPLLRWSLISALVFVLLMMNEVWPDAYRLLTMRQR